MAKKRAPGGGRKPLYADKTTKVAITLLPAQVEAMKQLGNGNLSAGIRKAINMNMQAMAKKFGTIEHEGKTYTLTQVADYSNRVFPGWYGDAQEGEEYVTEFSAKALDDDGNEYWVYWMFDTVKGEEPADNGNWPWDEVARVVAQ